MNEFTATNGYRIVPVNDNQPVKWIQVHNKNPDPELSERHSLGLYSVDALREFFRAEDDERLGRWRSSESPESHLAGGIMTAIDERPGGGVRADKFTASNGVVITIYTRSIEVLDGEIAQAWIDPRGADALREFFRAELKPAGGLPIRPTDEQWDRTLDDYREAGWEGEEPAEWERMFWEAGFRQGAALEAARDVS